MECEREVFKLPLATTEAAVAVTAAALIELSEFELDVFFGVPLVDTLFWG